MVLHERAWRCAMTRAPIILVLLSGLIFFEALSSEDAVGIGIGSRDLLKAVRRGDLDGVKALLESGQDPNYREESEDSEPGFTPLLEAAQGNTSRRVELAEVLLKAGAHVNDMDIGGETALHFAVRHGDLPLAQVLLEHGADVTIVSHRGYTPGFLAVELPEDDPRIVDIWKVLDLLVQKGGSYWLTIPDMADRTVWEWASKEDLRHLPAEPSFWEMQRIIFTNNHEIYVLIGIACFLSVPLTLLIVVLQTSSEKSSEQQARFGPSLGAQHLASMAVTGHLSLGGLAFRTLEVFTATVLPAWTFGYYLMPGLSVAALTLVYVVPTPLLVGSMPALQFPALLLASAPRSISKDPQRAMRTGLPVLLLRSALLLVFPWAIIKLPYIKGAPWMKFRYNSHMELPSRNEWAVVHPNEEYHKGHYPTVGLDCLLAPAELFSTFHPDFQSPCLGVWMPWAHLYIPTGLIVGAGVVWLFFRLWWKHSEEEANALADRKGAQIRDLAEELDRIASQAAPHDCHVWETTAGLLERQHKNARSFAEPLNICNFWRSPYFDLSLLYADTISDLLTIVNIFTHRHYHLGALLLTSLLSSTAAQLWFGHTPLVMLQEARESARIGFRTPRFASMQLHEAGWEAFPSVAVSVFTFWFNVNSRLQVIIPLFSLTTSIIGLAKFLHQKLDLELPALKSWDEDEDEERYYSPLFRSKDSRLPSPSRSLSNARSCRPDLLADDAGARGSSGLLKVLSLSCTDPLVDHFDEEDSTKSSNFDSESSTASSRGSRRSSKSRPSKESTGSPGQGRGRGRGRGRDILGY